MCSRLWRCIVEQGNTCWKRTELTGPIDGRPLKNYLERQKDHLAATIAIWNGKYSKYKFDL
ncbi:hypothetical protein BpHYR1_020890 [Brachionus plicatilis]|uniref:Uncharacterized protein n=1 Tax=Brachionus plicatilis TaxID=10195 RepID=A0A3M7RW29_BRAPC|nr:hypothetical protein BpHYR1_020890 [Brachionus plicatilis]